MMTMWRWLYMTINIATFGFTQYIMVFLTHWTFKLFTKAWGWNFMCIVLVNQNPNYSAYDSLNKENQLFITINWTMITYTAVKLSWWLGKKRCILIGVLICTIKMLLSKRFYKIWLHFGKTWSDTQLKGFAQQVKHKSAAANRKHSIMHVLLGNFKNCRYLIRRSQTSTQKKKKHF